MNTNPPLVFLRFREPESTDDTLILKGYIARHDMDDPSGRVLFSDDGEHATFMTKELCKQGHEAAGIVADGYVEIKKGEAFWVITGGAAMIRASDAKLLDDSWKSM